MEIFASPDQISRLVPALFLLAVTSRYVVKQLAKKFIWKCLGLQSYPSIGTKKSSRNSIETEGSKYSLLSKLFIIVIIYIAEYWLNGRGQLRNQGEL